MKKENQRWMIMGNVMMSFTTPGPIDDDLWNDFVKDLKTKQYTKYLGVSVGALEVTSIQRKLSAEAVKGRGISLAFVTDERIVRGLVTAVSWLGVDIKSFSWGELRQAINHLEVKPPLEDEIFAAAMKLKSSYVKS